MRYVILFLSLSLAVGCNKRGSGFVEAIPAPAPAPPVNTAAPKPNPAALPAESAPPSAKTVDSPSLPKDDSPAPTKEPVASVRTLPEGEIYAEYFDTAAGPVFALSAASGNGSTPQSATPSASIPSTIPTKKKNSSSSGWRMARH